MAGPRPTPAWSVRTRSAPRWNGPATATSTKGGLKTPTMATSIGAVVSLPLVPVAGVVAAAV